MSEEIANIGLNELAKNENISVRSRNVCIYNGLIDLEKILHHYWKNGNFKNIRNCGNKTNQELIDICNKFKNSIIQPAKTTIEQKKENELTQLIDNVSIFKYEEIKNIDLKELADIENLSKRTCNICEDNNLFDLEKILKYFWENGNFNKIRNCGNKTNMELIDICDKYKYSILHQLKPTVESKHENKLIIIIDNLTIQQKAILNNLINDKFKKLTPRSFHALSNYLNNTITLRSLKDLIFSNLLFNIDSLRNVGSKTRVEINNFLKETKELIELVSVFDNEAELNKEMFNALLIKQFSVDLKTLNKIGENYDFSNGIPVFKTIHILIERNQIFKEKEKTIFNNSLDFFQNRETETLDGIGNKLGITRERIRQIRYKILKNFNRYFSFVSFFEKENLNLFNLDTSSSFLFIDQTLLENISKTESVNFNQFFITRIFSIIFRDVFTLIGNEHIIKKEKKSLHKWKTTYLIRNNFCKFFNFEKMVNDVSKRLSKRITEEYKFHFQTYLLNFKKADCFEFLDEISQISEQILFNEFETIIDHEENIVFKRNSHKPITDYIYDILKEVNEPIAINVIFEILNNTNPGIVKSYESVRSNCLRDNRIIPIGKTSTYGLKIWEQNFDNIKRGTMHDISDEYLLKFDTPKHIDDIAEYVNNYRSGVSSKNLLYNLKSAEHRRFVFFQNGYIGLTSKTYDSNLFSSIPNHHKNKKTWEKNFQLLLDFSRQNKLLPISSGNEEEKKLYRFLNIQLRRLDELDETKKEKIQSILSNYNYQKRKRYSNILKWDKSYKELKSFIIEHNRFPSAQISGEQKLYGFFYRQRKRYQYKQLPKECLFEFLEIFELIKI